MHFPGTARNKAILTAIFTTPVSARTRTVSKKVKRVLLVGRVLLCSLMSDGGVGPNWGFSLITTVVMVMATTDIVTMAHEEKNKSNSNE